MSAKLLKTLVLLLLGIALAGCAAPGVKGKAGFDAERAAGPWPVQPYVSDS